MIMMQVDVKLYATLRRLAPRGLEVGEAFRVKFDGNKVSDLLQSLNIKPDQAKIVMCNGVRIAGLDQELSEGDLVVIFPPVGGGSIDLSAI